MVAAFVYGAAVVWLLFAADRGAPTSYLVPVLLAVPGYLIAVRKLPWRRALALGVGLRLAAVFAFPLLSDDIYRFLWDGELWLVGYNPLDFVPADAPSAFAKTFPELFDLMNSRTYFTVYPPLSQLVFVLAAKLSTGAYWGAVALKSLLLLAELGVITLLFRLDATATKSGARAYLLHPLVIVEVIGNAHFEGFALLGALGAYAAVRKLSASKDAARHPRVGSPASGGSESRSSSVETAVSAPAARSATAARAVSESTPPAIRSAPRRHAGMLATTPKKPVATQGGSVSTPSRVRATGRRAGLSIVVAATALAAAGLVKLVPLVLAPALAFHSFWRKPRPDWPGAILLGSVTAFVFGLGLFFMFWGADMTGFGESLDLYFRNFEFNGSLYTLARGFGEWYKGYNWIARVGPSLAVAGTIAIIGLSAYRAWRGLSLANTLLWAMSIYLLCATTVHPWYFVHLLGLAALGPYRWPYLLGFTAFLSYVAYVSVGTEVPDWVLVCEYVPVLALAAWEVKYLKDGGAHARGPLF